MLHEFVATVMLCPFRWFHLAGFDVPEKLVSTDMKLATFNKRLNRNCWPTVGRQTGNRSFGAVLQNDLLFIDPAVCSKKRH